MTLKFASFFPELLLFGMSFYLLFSNLYRSSLATDKNTFLSPFLPRISYYVFLFSGFSLLVFLWMCMDDNQSSSFDVFSKDKLAVGAKLVVFILGVPWLGLGAKGIRRSFQRENMRSFEYPSLLLFSMIGSFLMVSSSHLVGSFVALSMQILPVLVAICLYEDNTNTSSIVWATRLFVLEGICLSFFIFGAALLYGAVGDLNIKSIAIFCQSVFQEGGEDLRAVTGLFMILIVFLLRLAAFPFHLWIKGFYQSSSNLIVPFMATLSFSIFISLTRLLFEGFYAFVETWKPILFYVGLSSCLWGAIGALFQTHIRSFFSYNYMFHLGMVLLGLSSGAIEGLHASLLYWVVYTLSMSVFFFFWSNLSVNDQMLDDIEQARGLGIKHPVFTLLISLTLLSLASIPPFAGFWCKLYVLKSLISSGWVYVSALLIFTIVASFQYFHIIRAIYFSDQGTEIRVTYDWKTIWTLVPIVLVCFFLFQDRFLDVIKEVIRTI